MNSFSLRIHHYIQPSICLGEGRVQQSVTILAPYIEKFCSIIVFGRFSCGTYIIVVFNSNTVVFPNLRNLFFNSFGDFQHGFTIPIRSGTHGHVSTSSYEHLSDPWVNKLQFTIYPSTETISKAFILTAAETVWCSHSTFTLHHLLL